MADLVLSGATSGSVTLSAQAVSGSTTLTLPTTSGTVLTSASSVAASQLPAGSVVQVVNTQIVGTYSYSGTWPDTAVSGTITPSSTSSRILVWINLGRVGFYISTTVAFRVMRNGTQVGVGDTHGSRQRITASSTAHNVDANHAKGALSLTFIDSPSSTSALTYTMQIQGEAGATVYLNRNGSYGDNSNDYQSTALSSIILMEVKG